MGIILRVELARQWMSGVTCAASLIASPFVGRSMSKSGGNSMCMTGRITEGSTGQQGDAGFRSTRRTAIPSDCGRSVRRR